MISKQLYQRIWASFSQFGYRKDEPGQVSCDRPIRMEDMIEGAIAKRMTSYENLARIASTEPRVVENRVMNAMNMTTTDSSLEELNSKTLNFDELKTKLNK